MVTQDSFVRQVHVGGGRDGSDDNWQFAMGEFFWVFKALLTADSYAYQDNVSKHDQNHHFDYCL